MTTGKTIKIDGFKRYIVGYYILDRSDTATQHERTQTIDFAMIPTTHSASSLSFYNLKTLLRPL